MKGTPGWPGPPVRNSRTPRGALVLFPAATWSRSVPGTCPLGSTGTVSIEQVKPDTPEQGCESASTGRGWVLAEVLLVTPVHAETVANTAAAAVAGSQVLSFTSPSTLQRRIQLLSVRYPGGRPSRAGTPPETSRGDMAAAGG